MIKKAKISRVSKAYRLVPLLIPVTFSLDNTLKSQVSPSPEQSSMFGVLFWALAHVFFLFYRDFLKRFRELYMWFWTGRIYLGDEPVVVFKTVSCFSAFIVKV
jgi:hypothetical protein